MVKLQRHLLFVLFVFVLAVLQTTLVPMLLPGWLHPDMLMATVVLTGLFFQPASGALYAFGLGYLQDLMTGSMVGLFTFDRLVIYLAGYWLAGQFYAKSAPAQAILVGMLSIFDFFLLWLLGSIFSGGESIVPSFWQVIPRSVSSAVFGLALFFPISMIWEGGQRELG